MGTHAEAATVLAARSRLGEERPEVSQRWLQPLALTCLPDRGSLVLMGEQDEGEDFPSEVIEQAWSRARGDLESDLFAYCECMRVTCAVHGPKVPCGTMLLKDARGARKGLGPWEAHHTHGKGQGGKGVLSNCEILCWPCHKETLAGPAT